jgi:hypothetical protein
VVVPSKLESPEGELMFETNVLLTQLAELGRELDKQVDKLGDLDMIATGLGCHYQVLREAYEDAVADAFLKAPTGGVEAKKMEARLKCVPSRLVAQEANLEWEKSKSRVRTQQAAIKALHTRIEIGRSLLSTEKARMDLDRMPYGS